MGILKGLSNVFLMENTNSRNMGDTGKEMVVEETEVTLSSNAASDVPTSFAAGEIVYVVPAYQVTVAADGNLDVDFSALPDTAAKILVVGKYRQLTSD